MTSLAETAAGSRPLAALAATMPPRTGVCLALVQGQSRTFLTRGRTVRTTGGDPVTPDTAFEVGSVTKTFTALLLAEMAGRGELAYDDPINAYLPAGHRPAVLHGGPVTLLHLATHTSGLPRLPPGLLRSALPAWFTNPYAGYSGPDLLRSLARTRIRARPGSRVRYSNYGVGLLGRLLADTAGTSYPELLRQRVCAPLGLTGTRCEPDPLTQVTGHRHGKALPPWCIPGLPGAGAVRSTGRDLACFLAAHIDAAAAPGSGPGSTPTGAPLAAALRDVQQPRVAKPHSRDQLCLIWNLRRRDARDVLFHSGATCGFTTFVGFCPQAGVGVAALANNATSLRCQFIQTAYELLLSLIPETR